ncbi:MAG: DUF2125 domain-containing protein [Pseudomonadota bacterium]
MTRFSSLVPFLAGSLLASPVFADLSAEEAWQLYRETNAEAGDFSFEGADVSRNEVTVTGATLVLGDDLNTVVVELGTLVFAEASGGVALTLAPRIPMQMEFDVEGDRAEVQAAILMGGSDIVLSGSADEMIQTYSIAQMEFVIEEIEDMPEGMTFDISATLMNLNGQTSLSGSDTRAAAFSATADSLVYDVSAVNPQDGNFSMDAALNGIGMTGTSNFPTGFAAMQAGTLFQNPDYALDAVLNTQSLSLSASFSDPSGDGAFEMAAGAGSVAMDISDGAVAYDGGLDGLEMSAAVPDLPLPVNVNLARYGYKVSMPMVPTEEVRPMAFGIDLIGLEIDDFLWNLFDPGTVLPRDPADLTFLANLTGRWLVDITDPDAPMQAMLAGDSIFEVETADISNLRLSAAGSELTGKGAFTFDNDDLFTFDGMPAPDGGVDLKLVGGNGLIDKLVQMGLLPQEQAMGARMMLGLFAVPGEGEDTLTSRIDVTPDGQVLANGQRIR